MTAGKKPHPWRLGEAAHVLDVRHDKVVDEGTIYKITPGRITFKSSLGDGRDHGIFFGFRRKGRLYVELKKDHFQLVSPRL